MHHSSNEIARTDNNDCARGLIDCHTYQHAQHTSILSYMFAYAGACTSASLCTDGNNVNKHAYTTTTTTTTHHQVVAKFSCRATARACATQLRQSTAPTIDADRRPSLRYGRRIGRALEHAQRQPVRSLSARMSCQSRTHMRAHTHIVVAAICRSPPSRVARASPAHRTGSYRTTWAPWRFEPRAGRHLCTHTRSNTHTKSTKQLTSIANLQQCAIVDGEQVESRGQRARLRERVRGGMPTCRQQRGQLCHRRVGRRVEWLGLIE